MANLSQLRRQRMLAFLEKMREQHKDDDEVLVAINEVENEINEKKYGLVWEEHSEEVEERMVDEVPIFVEDKDKEITMTDNDYNFLLEGDNLHSLHLLEKTHKEKIDVIYIDPPYNTGNDDFIYDDSRVGKDDCFRHSKWLSFMAHRLAIAKNLLSTDGAIFISIDDNEEAQLKSLCDAVFGEQNFVACIPRMTSAKRPAQEAYVSIQHDYLLVYVKQKIGNFRKIIGRQGLEKVKKDNIGTYIPGDTSPILASATQGYSAGGDYDFEYKGVVYSPVANDGSRRRWLWTKDRMEKAAELGILVPTRSGGLRVQNYIDMEFEVGTNLMKPKESNLILASYDFMNSQYVNKNGAQALVDAGVSFSFPKPVQLVKDIISLCDKSDAVVLDFFAGSGTTGQAVLELNRADGGNRHFILCTDNQNNICGGVTYPRLRTVITGIRQDGSKYSDNIPADLKYYHTDYIPKNSGTLVQDLISHIDEMIQLEYGVKIDKEKYISILTDEDADELEKNWTNYPNIRAIYISRHVLLTGKQKELFGTHDCFTIPDYYFREELREAGEA